eukprot:365843-Chlamydomonas_euryale.AAC.8
MAGGTIVAVAGSGFNTDASANRVSLGGSPCTVLSVTPTELTCRTGAAPSDGSAAVDAVLSAAALPGLPLAVWPNVTFSYDPQLSDVVTSVNTTRGSTAGGTALAVAGNFRGAAEEYSVLLGTSGATCEIVSFTQGWERCFQTPEETASAHELCGCECGRAAFPVVLVHTSFPHSAHPKEWK